MNMKQSTLLAMTGTAIYFMSLVWNLIRLSIDFRHILGIDYYAQNTFLIFFSLSLFVFLFTSYKNEE